MSEAERVAAIDGYNERQLLREKQRLAEEKRRLVRAEREARERELYIQAVYTGKRGRFGDLLRVSLRGGRMRLSGKHRKYRPFSFTIADTECKKLEYVRKKKYHVTRGILQVCYQRGTLLVDVAGRDLDYGAQAFAFDSSWMKGETYQHVETDGRAELKNVNVHIMAVSSQNRVVEHRVW